MAYTDAQRGIALDIIHKYGGITQQAIAEAQATLSAPGLSGSTLHGWLKRGEKKPSDSKRKSKKAESKRPKAKGRIAPPSDLTIKRRLFVEWYPALLNGTEAARAAGYQGDDNVLAVNASRLLRNPKIAAAIEKRLSERIMSANEVAARLSEQARGDLGEFINLEFTNEFANHPQSRLLKKFKKTHRVYKDKTTEDTIEFELYNAQAALELIGKYHAIFTDKIQVDNWESQAIEDIRAGRLDFNALVKAFDKASAERLFSLAGVSVEVGSNE